MNIPQMTKIIRYHGLIPIPVEIDPGTLSPNIKDLEAAITPKTKVFFFKFFFFFSVYNLYLLSSFFEIRVLNLD